MAKLLNESRRPPKWFEVRKSSIHRRGAFACRDIPAGIRLVEYVGPKLTKKKADEECLRQNRYVFTLNETTDIDGSVSWNHARWINHSCEPNCECTLDDGDHLWIYSIKPIPRGEELTFNYGYGLENYMDYPCRCGAPACLGYMVAEEHFPALRRLLTEARL